MDSVLLAASWPQPYGALSLDDPTTLAVASVLGWFIGVIAAALAVQSGLRADQRWQQHQREQNEHTTLRD